MKKIFWVVVFTMLVCVTSVLGEELEGTYKFTNTLSASAKITFSGEVDSDVIIYKSNGQIASYTPCENIKSGGSITLSAGYSCEINNISSDVTFPEGVTCEKSEKTQLIARHSLKSDAGHGYLIENSLDYHINFGIFSNITGKSILYDKNGAVIEYDLAYSMNNSTRNGLEAGRSRYIEGTDGEIFLPYDSGLTFTECTEAVGFTEYQLSQDKNYLITNSADKNLWVRVTKGASCTHVLYDKNGNIKDYGEGFSFYSYQRNDIGAGESRWITGMDTVIYYPTEFDITITEAETESRFERVPLSAGKNYLITNTADQNLWVRVTNGVDCTHILYAKDGSVKEFGDGFSFHSYQGNGISAGESRWITGMDTEMYYPKNFGITVTEAEAESRLTRVLLTASKNYLITNTTDKHLWLRSTKGASCTSILYNKDGSVREYGDGFTFYSYQGSGLDAGNSRWITGVDTELYYPTQFGITITESADDTRYERHILSPDESYLITNTTDSGVSYRVTKHATGLSILYAKDGSIREYGEGFSYYSYQGSGLDAGNSRWVTGIDTELYYPIGSGITVTKAEAESRVIYHTLENGKIYAIKNVKDAGLGFRVRESGAMSYIRKNAQGVLYEYNIKGNLYGHSYCALANGETLYLENGSFTVYFPRESGYEITEVSQGLFNKHTFTKDKSYRIENKSGYDNRFVTLAGFTADVINYSGENVYNYNQNQNISSNYSVGKNCASLFTEAEGEIYVPRELEEAGLFTVTEGEYIDAIRDYSLSETKAYEFKNTADKSLSLNAKGLKNLRTISYNSNGEMKNYNYHKNGVNTVTINAGEILILEGGEGTVSIPFEYGELVSITEKDTRYFTVISLADGEAVRIDNSYGKDIQVMSSGQNYSLITFNSPTQKKYIQSQNRDFAVYRSKYALVKNISGENTAFYIPRELADRYIKYSPISSSVFESSVMGSYVSIDISRTFTAPSGSLETITDFIGSYWVTAFNNTQNKEVGCEKNLQGVYLNEGDVAPFDSVTFTIVSKTTKAESVTLTLDESCHGEVVFAVLELGRIKGRINGEDMNRDYHLTLYNQEGRYVLRERMTSGASSVIADGEYTAVFMRKKGNDPYFPYLDDLAGCELIENVHYVKAKVTITAGTMTVLDFAQLPQISDDDLSYLVLEETSLTVTGISSTKSEIARLTFEYKTKEGAIAGLNNATFVINVDNRIEIYEDEITVNGEKPKVHWYNRTLYVTLPKDEGRLDIYMKFLRNDTYEFSPKITYRGDHIDKTENITPYKFSNKLVTLYTQPTASIPSVKVTGTSYADKPVYIYCDGILMQETVAKKNGVYDAYVHLPWGITGKEYSLYATDGDGSVSDTVYVTYMPNKPSLKEFVLKVYRGGKPDVIDLMSDEIYSYVFPLNWDFCYEAEFAGPELEAAFVLNKAGDYLKLYYDEASGKYTTGPKSKGDFVIADTVTYIYDGPYHVNNRLGMEEKLENLPPVILKSERTATDMPLSDIPQDILDACKGVADPEHYIKLSLTSLAESGEDISFTFDVVLCKDNGDMPSDGSYTVPSDTVLKSGNAYLSFDNFTKAMFGSDYRTSSRLEFRSKQMGDFYYANYSTSIRNPGGTVGAEQVTYGRPIADLGSTDKYQKMLDENSQFVEDNYGGNPVAESKWDEFKDGVANMAGDVAGVAYGAKGAVDGYKDTKELGDRIMDILYSVSGPDPNAPKKNAFQYFDEAFLVPKFFSFDPSGYVYEGYRENPVKDVTVTAYYDDEKGEKVLWDAEEWGQKNPLSTDEYGAYAWDVPEGVWSVKYEKDGYIDAWREGLVVPPPRTEVNVGLVATVGGEIESVTARDDGILVTFTKPVFAEDISAETVKLMDGALDVIGETVAGECYESEFGVLTKTAVIIPEKPLTSGREYQAFADVGTYNGIKTEDDIVYLHKALKLTADAQTVNLNENGTAFVKLTLSGEDTDNSQLYVTDGGAQVTKYELTRDGDEFTLMITGLSVGAEALTVGVCDTKIMLKLSVNVFPENYNFSVDRKMTYNGYEKMLYVSSPTKEIANIVVAEFDSNGRFVGARVRENVTLEAKTNEIDMSEYVTGTEYKLKLMAMDALLDIKPIAKAVVY